MVSGDFIAGALTMVGCIYVIPAIYNRLDRKGKIPTIVQKVVYFVASVRIYIARKLRF